MTSSYYLPIGDEVEVFTAAYAKRLPVLLKGPTGCGKTRFVEYMAAHAAARRAKATPATWSPSPATRI